MWLAACELLQFPVICAAGRGWQCSLRRLRRDVLWRRQLVRDPGSLVRRAREREKLARGAALLGAHVGAALLLDETVANAQQDCLSSAGT